MGLKNLVIFCISKYNLLEHLSFLSGEIKLTKIKKAIMAFVGYSRCPIDSKQVAIL